MIQRAGQFMAQDENGTQYTIVVYRRPGAAGSRPVMAAVHGLEFRTPDGRIVSRLGRGLFEVSPPGGVRLTSDDPEAP